MKTKPIQNNAELAAGAAPSTFEDSAAGTNGGNKQPITMLRNCRPQSFVGNVILPQLTAFVLPDVDSSNIDKSGST